MLCLPFQAKALTDEDHTRYAREFPAYSQAEQRLNTAWKQLKQRLSKEEFQALLAEQRNWITTVRDAEAKAIAGPGPFTNAGPLANAYAQVTAQRAAALEARAKAPAAKDAHVGNAGATAKSSTAGQAGIATKEVTPGQTAIASKEKSSGQQTAPTGKAPSLTPSAPNQRTTTALAQSASPASDVTTPQEASPVQPAPAAQGAVAPQTQMAQGGPGVPNVPAAPVRRDAPGAHAPSAAQGAPIQQNAPAGKGAPVTKNPPASQNIPAAGGTVGTMQARQSTSVAQSPSLTLTPIAPAGNADRRASLIGSYGSDGNLVEIMASGKGYYVAVSTTAPDARWVCEMQGVGLLEGDILYVTSVSSGQHVVTPIQVREDGLIIPTTQGAVCGPGGSIEGVYKRK